eukprot:jgi/Psemu1/36778/gm1.36778_g
MGFERTNLAETIASQLLAFNKRRKPPHWTNVILASLYNDSVSKLMSKAGIQSAAKSTQPSSTVSSIGQMINHFNSKESDVVTYIPDGQHSFVENHYGVDGVSVVLKCKDKSTAHQIVFKWNHCSNDKYLNRNRHDFEQDIMSTRNLLCFNTSCSRHVEFTQMRSSICACFPIIFDFAKKHSYWALPLTIPVPGLVEGLVYHESCLSLCSRQLITKAIPPSTQSNPFTSTSMSLELHLPTTIDTQNLYCPIHMLPAPCYSESTNSKGRCITSKGELTTFPNSIDGNLDSSGIKTLDKLTNINPNLTGLRNQAISDFCPLLDIKPGEFIIYHLSVTGQELCYSPNPDSFPFDVQPFSLQTNSTSRSNGLRDIILLNGYDRCFFNGTNFGDSTDGGGIILQDQDCLTFSLNNKPGTNTLSHRLYGSGNLSVSAHLPMLDEIHMGTRSTDVGSVDSPVSIHSQMLDEISIGAKSTDVALVSLSAHLQTLDEIRIGARSTDVALVNLSANIDGIQRAAKLLDTPNISQPVGKNLTQASLLDPHESNLSQSTAAALLAIMGSDSDKSKPTASNPSKPLAPNLMVPPPESPLDSKNSNSDDSLPPPIDQPNPPAQIHKLTTNAPASHPIQSPASTEIKEVLENIVVGERPVSNKEAPKLSKAVRGIFNNHQGIMSPTALNVIVDLFNHQSIPSDCVRPRFFCHNTLCYDPELVKTKELRALLFVLDIRYRLTMNKLHLRELLSDALSHKWFSDVAHWSESNVTRGKFKISDNPSYVREAIMGSKLKNPSDYRNLYCEAANSDFNNYNSDIKHKIELDNAYAELYRVEEESHTSQKIGRVVQNGSESNTDWESPPPLPVQGMDTGQVKFTQSSNHLRYIQSNGNPANGKITNQCSNVTEALTIECRDKNQAQFVDLYEYKQGLVVVNKCVLWLGTSIKGDCRLEITLPKAEKILMLLVFDHASESNVDIAYHSSTKTGLNSYSICYSSGGYLEELSLPQPDKSTLMPLYFQCDQAGMLAILSFFNKCQEENKENTVLEPILVDKELAHCFGVFLHRQKHANNLNKNQSFSSRFLGLPMSQFLIEKVAKKAWPMFVDIFQEGTAKNYQTLYNRSCASGLQKMSWDSYKTFVDDYRALDFSAPKDMANARLSGYTISLWCFMMSIDKEEYRISINFDFNMTPKRRLYIIPVNLGGWHWAVNLVFHASNGHYSAIQ